MPTKTTIGTGLGFQRPNQFAIPPECDKITASYLRRAIKAGPDYDEQLQRIRDQYEGGPNAISSTYFPQPAGCKEHHWAEYRTLLTHVNLVKPAVRTWVASVYGGDKQREIVDNPYADHVRRWVDSIEYDQATRAICENAVLYGTAVAVPVLRWNGYIDKNGNEYPGLHPDAELGVWIPDPLKTVIETNPLNCDDVEAIIEIHEDRVIFITKYGSGWITEENGHYEPAQFDRIPCVIARGINRTHLGDVRGGSLVSDAAEFSIRVTSFCHKLAILQAIQTRSYLFIFSDDEIPKDATGNMGPHMYMRLKETAKAEFKTPDPKIAETAAIVKSNVGLLSVTSSIPADILDATLAESASSAEAARIRATPLLQQSAVMVPCFRHLEEQLILMGTAVCEMAATRSPVSIRKLSKQVTTQVRLDPQLIPVNESELVSTVAQAVGAYLMPHEDGIRKVCRGIVDEKVEELVQQRSKAMEAGDSAAQITDQSTKESKITGAPIDNQTP